MAQEGRVSVRILLDAVLVGIVVLAVALVATGMVQS